MRARTLALISAFWPLIAGAEALEPIGMVLGLAADMTTLMMQYAVLDDDDDPDRELSLNKLTWSSVAF